MRTERRLTDRAGLLLDISKLLSRYRRKARRHRRSPAEAERRWRGKGASREGSVSVSACIALLKAEVERKRTPTPIISWPVRGSSPLTRPGIPAGGHGLLPQLQARERAAHTGTVSEQCLEPNRARFLRQLKRISVLMDSVVRVSLPQPASPVSVGHVRAAKIGAAVPRVSEISIPSLWRTFPRILAVTD